MYFYYNPYPQAYYQPIQDYYVNDASQVFDYYASAAQHVPVDDIKKSDDVNTAHSSTSEKPVKEQACDSLDQMPFKEEENSKPDRILLEHDSDVMPCMKRSFPKRKAKNNKGKHIPTLGSRPRYVHKNFESNMVNKIFFFLWTEGKSGRYVRRILGSDERVNTYYEYISVVRKYSKKSIHKEYLLDLCNYQPRHIAYRIVANRANEEILTMSDFSMAMRRLIGVYLRGETANSVLTSKKMKSGSWKDHFEKARTIQRYLFDKLPSHFYDYQIIESYTELHQQMAEDSA